MQFKLQNILLLDNFTTVSSFIQSQNSGVRESISSLKYAGVDIKMVTGDSEETATGIGVRLGIHE